MYSRSTITAPPSSGSLLRWISHQRAMSCRTRLRVDCDLGTLPVNVRTSRAPSLSIIRQCRKATSKGSSFFSEKFTLNIGLGWVCVILPPHCVRSLGSVYHSHWRSIRFADAVFGQADTAQPLYLSCVASAPARLSKKGCNWKCESVMQLSGARCCSNLPNLRSLAIRVERSSFLDFPSSTSHRQS
jgi:hypothetical protein